MAAVTYTQPALNVNANFVARFLKGALNLMVTIAESNQRLAKARYLSELTDAQLAEKGMKREEIVNHVFRDVYYV